jgi:hypothetical protein
LQRHDFLDRFVHTGASIIDDTDIADVDWSGAITALAAGDLPCAGARSDCSV